MVFSDIIKALVQLGSFGVLAWVVWWVFSRMVPDMIKNFMEAIDRMRADFRSVLNEQRNDAKESRQEFMKELDACHQSSRAVANAIIALDHDLKDHARVEEQLLQRLADKA